MNMRHCVGLILALPREAGEPLSHRDITLRVMAHRGLNVADRQLYDTLRTRVGASSARDAAAGADCVWGWAWERRAVGVDAG